MYNRYDRAAARRKQMEKEQREMAKEAVFMFDKPVLQDLWNNELVGQISDGMWENTANTGWVFWCNLNTALGERTRIEGRVTSTIKRNFRFSALIEYVGDDMIDIIRKYEPDITPEKANKYLKQCLKEISDALKAS